MNKQILEQMKKDTAYEMGVEIGAEQTARNNGSVGGKMTKKLIKLGEMKLEEMVNTKGLGNVEIDDQEQQQNNNLLH